MRFLLFLSILLLFACDNKKATIVKRQKAVMKEMEQVKAVYYKTSDSLVTIKNAESDPAKQFELANEIIKADRKKSLTLIRLQKEYDSLEAVLKKR